MQNGKTNFTILIISILALTFIFYGVSAFGGQGQGKPQVVAIQGLAKVEGQDAIVEILVAVQPGENAMAKAREKLRRMYPDAVEIDSSNYSLTGLDWNIDDDFKINNQVTFFYNDIGRPVSNDTSVKDDAYNTWNSVADANFQFIEAYNVTFECPSLVKECKGRQYFNGDNEIAWLDIRESSVLGVVWSGTSRDGPEFDMALDNADFDWYVGTDPNGILSNQIDLQTVWIHEFGHGLGLGHSGVSDSVMYPKYTEPRRDLYQDDINGILSLYSSVDLPPTVTITKPADGAKFASGANISFTGTAVDKEDGDLKGYLEWNSDVDGYLGKGGIISDVLSGGVSSNVTHEITASVTDSNGGTGSDSVNITVIVPGNGNENDIYIWAIDFTEKRKGRGGSLVDLITTVTIHRDSDANGSSAGDELVGGASVQMTLDREGLENPFVFSGTTNSEGIVKFTLQHARTTTYTAIVTGVTHSNSTYTYNDSLNEETLDSHTIN